MAFSPDGTKIVSGSFDKTIKVWDAGRLAPTSPCMILNRQKLASPAVSAGTLELKATKENAHDDEISSVAFNPDGKTIVSACFGGTIKVWDAGTLARKSFS